MNLSPELVSALITLLAVVGLLIAWHAWTRRVAHLQLGIFRPYRGETWPIGVQEQDTVRFDWSPTIPPADAVTAVEEPGDPVAAERVDRIRIRRR